ncbi:MAG: acyl-CoA dehydrogenase family protein [Rhodospirillales bacterium]
MGLCPWTPLGPVGPKPRFICSGIGIDTRPVGDGRSPASTVQGTPPRSATDSGATPSCAARTRVTGVQGVQPPLSAHYPIPADWFKQSLKRPRRKGAVLELRFLRRPQPGTRRGARVPAGTRRRVARRALESGSGFDAALWKHMGKLGWIGAAIPEEFGGSGLGDEGLCVLAEEIGHSLAATPFASSAYLASQAVLRFGSAAQKARWLPGLADGSVIGCFALAEGPGAPRAAGVGAVLRDGRLDGSKQPVVDGNVAHLCVVAARDGAEIVLALVDLEQGAVARAALQSLDPSRDVAKIVFSGAGAEALPGARGFAAVETLLDRAAVLFAFEQLGGAQACLEMAREYALQRQAFGRQIGSFQAIKA